MAVIRHNHESADRKKGRAFCDSESNLGLQHELMVRSQVRSVKFPLGAALSPLLCCFLVSTLKTALMVYHVLLSQIPAVLVKVP